MRQLAAIHGVSTSALNQAVKRNPKRLRFYLGDSEANLVVRGYRAW